MSFFYKVITIQLLCFKERQFVLKIYCIYLNCRDNRERDSWGTTFINFSKDNALDNIIGVICIIWMKWLYLVIVLYKWDHRDKCVWFVLNINWFIGMYIVFCLYTDEHQGPLFPLIMSLNFWNSFRQKYQLFRAPQACFECPLRHKGREDSFQLHTAETLADVAIVPQATPGDHTPPKTADLRLLKR